MENLCTKLRRMVGYVHTPTPLHPEKEPPTQRTEGWASHRTDLGVLGGGGVNFCRCQMESVSRLVTVMTELSRLLITVKQEVYN